MSPTVLVTGADGFVGGHMVSALISAGWHVRRAQRTLATPSPNGDVVTGLKLAASTDWSAALNGVQAIVHLAARAHRSVRVQQREKDLYFSINVEGTKHLARSAADAGVRHFVVLSSVAVNGSTTSARPAFNENDIAAPTTIYGQSKAAAEEALAKIAAESNMTITALRAPMIYGSGAGGNFQRLTSAARSGVPLPFASVRNRRAFLGIDNLTSFAVQHLSSSQPVGFEVFLLADDEQVSTPQFITELACACDSRTRLFPMPVTLLRIPLRRIGLSDALLESLEMDTSKARQIGWQPPLTMAAGLARAVTTTPPL